MFTQYWEKLPSELRDLDDQCIFLHYYKLKSRTFRRPKVIKAAAGPDELDYDPDDSERASPVPIQSSDGDSDYICEVYAFETEYRFFLFSHRDKLRRTMIRWIGFSITS